MEYNRIRELKKEGLTYGGLYSLLMLYRGQAPELMAFIEEAFLIECGYLDKDSLLTEKGEALAIEFEKSVLDILDVYNKDIEVIPATPMKSSSMNDTPTLIASAMVAAVEYEFGDNIKDKGGNCITGISDRASLTTNIKTFILKEVNKLKEIDKYKDIDFSTSKVFVDAVLRYMKFMKDSNYDGIQRLSRFILYTNENKEKTMKIVDYLIEQGNEHQEDYY
jgi:hypothetical protein